MRRVTLGKGVLTEDPTVDALISLTDVATLVSRRLGNCDPILSTPLLAGQKEMALWQKGLARSFGFHVFPLPLTLCF